MALAERRIQDISPTAKKDIPLSLPTNPEAARFLQRIAKLDIHQKVLGSMPEKLAKTTVLNFDLAVIYYFTPVDFEDIGEKYNRSKQAIQRRVGSVMSLLWDKTPAEVRADFEKDKVLPGKTHGWKRTHKIQERLNSQHLSEKQKVALRNREFTAALLKTESRDRIQRILNKGGFSLTRHLLTRGELVPLKPIVTRSELSHPSPMRLVVRLLRKHGVPVARGSKLATPGSSEPFLQSYHGVPPKYEGEAERILRENTNL